MRANRAVSILLAFVAVTCVGASVALASGGGESGEHGEAAACGKDHWSVANEILPESAVHNLCNAWGSTLLGEPTPDRTMHVLWGVVVFFLVLMLAVAAAKKFRRPGDEAILPDSKFGIFTVFELAGEALYGLMKDMMGDKHARHFFPIIASLFFFILFSNLIGLVPGMLGASDNFNTTLALAMVPFTLTHVYGIKEHGFVSYFAHFMGPIRNMYALPLMLLMLVIEMISHVARPLSLAIRLMGNMFGDHAVLTAFMGFGLLLVPLPVMVLGTIVCLVQALVFCLLSIVYIAMAVEHAEDH